jgi:5'-nucleotidase
MPGGDGRTDRPSQARVLLTNDDGHDTAGLRALRRSLAAAGFAVTTIAPDGDRSGTARRVSCHTPVDVLRVSGTDADPVFACSGTPVDCIRIGLMAQPFPEFDVVVLNHGVNVGDVATYSGTLGAALEAAILGVPALALSQQGRDRDLSALDSTGHDFSYASLAPHLVRAALMDPPWRAGANVNLPNDVLEEHAAVTRLGALAYSHRWMKPLTATEEGWTFHPYLGATDPAPRFDTAAGTDTAALLRGRVSITPLTLDWTLTGRQHIDAWAQRIAAAATTALQSRGR